MARDLTSQEDKNLGCIESVHYQGVDKTRWCGRDMYAAARAANVAACAIFVEGVGVALLSCTKHPENSEIFSYRDGTYTVATVGLNSFVLVENARWLVMAAIAYTGAFREAIVTLRKLAMMSPANNSLGNTCLDAMHQSNVICDTHRWVLRNNAHDDEEYGVWPVLVRGEGVNDLSNSRPWLHSLPKHYFRFETPHKHNREFITGVVDKLSTRERDAGWCSRAMALKYQPVISKDNRRTFCSSCSSLGSHRPSGGNFYEERKIIPRLTAWLVFGTCSECHRFFHFRAHDNLEGEAAKPTCVHTGHPAASAAAVILDGQCGHAYNSTFGDTLPHLPGPKVLLDQSE